MIDLESASNAASARQAAAEFRHLLGVIVHLVDQVTKQRMPLPSTGLEVPAEPKFIVRAFAARGIATNKQAAARPCCRPISFAEVGARRGHLRQS
jgi:hypothetical protein